MFLYIADHLCFFSTLGFSLDSIIIFSGYITLSKHPIIQNVYVHKELKVEQNIDVQ